MRCEYVRGHVKIMDNVRLETYEIQRVVVDPSWLPNGGGLIPRYDIHSRPPSFSSTHLHHAGCSLRVTVLSRMLVATRKKCTYFITFHYESRVFNYESSYARLLWKWKRNEGINQPNTLGSGRAKVQDASMEIKPRIERFFVFMMRSKGD